MNHTSIRLWPNWNEAEKTLRHATPTRPHRENATKTCRKDSLTPIQVCEWMRKWRRAGAST